MGKIKQLDDILSNKIAAGEVVERPASVVKELVENAIDANSSRIEIELEEAGLALIRILDDGEGIEEDDCLIAFHRHATSKIKDEHDLFRIQTLGFRGEALPSIASVSEMELKTSTGKSAGTYLLLRGGHVEKKESSNSRKGTEITVKNLFFNTPARLKYMKTVHTELGNVTDIVNRLALSHPDISFRLSHNGRRLLQTSGKGDILQVIAAIYGTNVARYMVPLHLESIDFTIKGYIAKPEITRASRNYISTIMNGRFIKNYPLAKAIQEGYHTLLPIGRYPICILAIEMDPLLVDVNVHPSKLEVRLSKEKELIELVTQGIQKVFKNLSLIPELNVKKQSQKNVSEEQQTLAFDHFSTKENMLKKTEDVSENDDSVMTMEEDSIASSIVFEEPLVTYERQPVSESFQTSEPVNSLQHEVEVAEKKTERVEPMYPIGQMHGTYILAQNDTGLYLIDQHAAQERIKYEYFREKLSEVTKEVQEMLIPLTLEYSSSEQLMIEQHKEELAQVGIFIEPFGPQSYIVRSHPQWFPKGSEQELIEQIIAQVLQKKQVNIGKLREEAAIMMSCKGSIKANHHLRNDEIFALLESLRKSSDPFTCPHGRPIILHFSTYEMEKMFKRVM